MKSLKAIFFCSLVGIALSAYLVSHHYSLLNGEGSFHSVCSINETVNCDAVNGSRYSEIAGFPIATLSLGFYLFTMLLSLLGNVNPYWRREVILALGALNTGGLVLSGAMAAISFFVIRIYCPFCMGLYGVILANAIATFTAARAFGFEALRQNPDRRKLSIVFTTQIILLLATQLVTRGALYSPLPIDTAEFLSAFRSAPKIEINPAGSPTMGNPDAPIKIVEFADFQCPTCGRAARHMHGLLAKYGHKIHVTFKNYPIDSACNPHIRHRAHLYACDAAKAAYCAFKQGKFTPVYEKLFENQEKMTSDNIRRWALEAGVEESPFIQCIGSEEVKQAIARDIDQGTVAEIGGTPTFYINGKKVPGILVEENLLLIFKELGV